MCIFGSPKQPSIQPTPTPAPAPIAAPAPSIIPPTSTPGSPSPTSVQSSQARRRRIAFARQGILSTIKTSPLGVTNEAASGKKEKLGT